MPHRVLEVDEILREITASVADIDPPTAVSLACCTKSFEQPALSALWKSQKELPTLVKTLPPDSWELQPTNPRGGGGKIMFTRVPSREEWTRFRRYASWVRVLRPSDVVTISDDIFRQLSSATSGGPVCPQLRRLTWTSTYGWKHAQQFLAPYLVSVVFLGEGGRRRNADLGLTSAISLLPTMYLEELDLCHLPPSAPIHSALSEVVQRLSARFKRFTTTSSFSDAAWKYLASLPNLESFRVSHTPPTEISESIPHVNAFPALTRVLIKTDGTCQHWSSLFSLFGSSPLRRVVVGANHRIQDVDVPSQVVIAILEAGLQQNINTLIFTGFDPTNLTLVSRLGPFGSLKNLKCNTWCRGVGHCDFPLTDSDIEQLAKQLPQLVILWLGHGCKPSSRKITIKSMICLSTHCLSLKSLRLPCNLTNISEDIEMESGEPDPRLEIQSSCMLRYLAFRWVAIPLEGDTKALKTVASALDHLFPQLHLSSGASAWKTTLDTMCILQRRRMDRGDTTCK